MLILYIRTLFLIFTTSNRFNICTFSQMLDKINKVNIVILSLFQKVGQQPNQGYITAREF